MWFLSARHQPHRKPQIMNSHFKDPFLNNRRCMTRIEASELLDNRTALEPKQIVHALNAIFDKSDERIVGFFDHEDAREISHDLHQQKMPTFADQREMLREVAGELA